MGKFLTSYPNAAAFVGDLCWGKPITARVSRLTLETLLGLKADLTLHPFCKPQCKTILQLFPQEAEKLFCPGAQCIITCSYRAGIFLSI